MLEVTYDSLHGPVWRGGTGVTNASFSYSGDARVSTATNANSSVTTYLDAVRRQADSVRTVLTVPGGSPLTYTQRYSYTTEDWLQSTWVTGAFASQTRQYA